MSRPSSQGRGVDPLTQAGVPARVAALRALERMRDDEQWATTAVHAALDHSTLDRRDRSLAASLAYETLRWQATLDWALAHVCNRPLDQLEPGVRDALRLGAWQLLYGRAPDSAAVSTTVAAVGHVVGARARGFVNGVLRGLIRRRDDLPWPDRSTDEGLALAQGYPAWIAAEARDAFGERAEALLAAGNVSPGVTLRATGGPSAREALLAELTDAGVDAVPAPHAPESVRARGADPARLAAVAQGRAVVQDEASTLVGRCVAAALGDDAAGARAVDLCAAPGGKATHLAELGLTVVAGDVAVARVRAMAHDTAPHPRRDALHPVVADGRRPPLTPASASAVLVDAPCTGLGVVRRRPELRWRIEPGDVNRLATLQHDLVVAAARLVAPGGVLVVSVCTWTLVETTDAADAADAALGDEFTTEASSVLTGLGTHDDGRVLLAPDTDDVDGMYVTVRRRGQ